LQQIFKALHRIYTFHNHNTSFLCIDVKRSLFTLKNGQKKEAFFVVFVENRKIAFFAPISGKRI